MRTPYQTPVEKEKKNSNRLKVIIVILVVIICAQFKNSHWFSFSPSARILYDVKRGKLHYVKFAYIDTVQVDSMDDRKYHLLTDSIIAKY